MIVNLCVLCIYPTHSHQPASSSLLETLENLGSYCLISDCSIFFFKVCDIIIIVVVNYGNQTNKP